MESRPVREQNALTTGGTVFDDVCSMIDKMRAMKDCGGAFSAYIDDYLGVVLWIQWFSTDC